MIPWPRTLEESIVSWTYGDERMSLGDFLAQIEAARSRYTPEQFAAGLVLFHYRADDYDSGGDFKIILQRPETAAEVEARLEDARQASARAVAASVQAAKDRERQERAQLVLLTQKYGAPSAEDLACAEVKP